MTETKFCAGCGQDVPIDQWQKNSHQPDGLQTRCRGCQTESVRKSRARRNRAVHWADLRMRERYPEEHAELVSAAMERMPR